MGKLSVSFKAGDYIELLPGFETEPGAIFDVRIEECTDETKPYGEPIIINIFPDVITPDNDGIHDFACFDVTGASFYHVEVRNRFGISVYENFGTILSNPICVWDGSCNRSWPNCSSSTLNEGNYEIIVTFSNCDHSVEFSQNVELLYSSSNRIKPNDTTLENIIELNAILPSSLSVHPNPSTGRFTVEWTGSGIGELSILNIFGQEVYRDRIPAGSTAIDLSGQAAGMYTIRLRAGNQIVIRKLILK